MKSPRLNVQWRMRLLLEQSNLSRAKRFEGNWKQNNVVVYSRSRFSRRGLWCKPSLNLAPIDARHEFYRSNSHRCDRFSPVEHLPRISISRHRCMYACAEKSDIHYEKLRTVSCESKTPKAESNQPTIDTRAARRSLNRHFDSSYFALEYFVLIRIRYFERCRWSPWQVRIRTYLGVWLRN